MIERKYVPFSEVRKNKTIIVDSIHPQGLVLGHWKGSATPDLVRHDTSAGCVLNALQQIPEQLDIPLVTANHFDIDGFAGVWSLLNPKLALEHADVLHQMALIGDFRELNLDLPGAATALKLVCWINHLEKTLFYPPFGADELEGSEQELCTQKFAYFNEHFTYQLQHPEHQPPYWQEEHEQVITDYALIHGGESYIEKFDDIGLVIVTTPRPVHYYALFSVSKGYDIVLSCYSDHRYELEYKYTTWIDLLSRPTLPRLNLKPLLKLLNSKETSGLKWGAEAITDTGPILRLNDRKLSKAERYGHPFERPIYTSGIAAEELKAMVVQFFEEGYKGIAPKRFWTWKEIKALQG